VGLIVGVLGSALLKKGILKIHPIHPKVAMNIAVNVENKPIRSIICRFFCSSECEIKLLSSTNPNGFIGS
jgi:hypothetical protein